MKCVALGMMLFAVSCVTIFAAEDPGAALGKYLAAHGYGTLRTDYGDRNSEYILPRINGKTVSMLIDTGCDNTCLTHECARSLGLKITPTKNHEVGVGGVVKGFSGLAPIASMTLLGYEINRKSLIEVLPEGAHLSREDGLFGYDYLKLNAVILPVGAKFILFKPGGAAAAPIDTYMKAMGFQSIPLRYQRGALCVDGQVNGQPFLGVVDCGASFTMFNLDYVNRVKGGAVLKSVMESNGVDGNSRQAFDFVPRNLQVGPLKFPKGTEVVTTAAAGLTLGHFDALIGYDLLAAHQAIIDLGHAVLWMK